MVKLVNGNECPVPCGKCPACYARRVSSWSFRLVEEDKRSDTSYFITLTYDTRHINITGKGYRTLCKRDVQLFFKKLRKYGSYDGCKSIKYYGVGEYGERTYRPHYHVILFNAKIDKIQLAWDKGSVHYGSVSEASIGYCLKYISKHKKIPLHENDDRQKEFALMSKRLGDNYLTEAMVNWHKSDLYHRMFCNLKDGKKIAMPRYYKDKLYNAEEREEAAWETRRSMLLKIEKMRQQDENYDVNKIKYIQHELSEMKKDKNQKKFII